MCGFIAALHPSSSEALKQTAKTLVHRGPDDTEFYYDETEKVFLGFHRLAIMDPTFHGNQPFYDQLTGIRLVCNGEIYNEPDLKPTCNDYPFTSGSDCEVLLPLLRKMPLVDVCRQLDAEFAMVFYDPRTKSLKAARDPMGIRPMFYGYDTISGGICFASEAKALLPLCQGVIKPFPPGHYYEDGQFICFKSYTKPQKIYETKLDLALHGIKHHLTAAVEKRLRSDVPVGFLLSGGLDSSLVCSLAARLSSKPIRTFAVGTNCDAIDLKYAEEVAKYLGTDHTSVTFSTEESMEILHKLIWHLETFDITTIRASVGMYLVCRYIREQTDIKVVLTGEVSDELFGYKYTDYAPSPQAFQEEAEKRISELYMYDVLRADRCISAHSLEARVPFSDEAFVDHVMQISPELKMNRWQMGKYLLRKAFEGDYLPQSILYREKAAFSDAVGHSMVDHLKAAAESKYSSEDLAQAAAKFPHATPFTKEALMYREIFESLYPGRSSWVSDFWMPNPEWQNCQVKDPSARALPNYGKSGV